MADTKDNVTKPSTNPTPNVPQLKSGGESDTVRADPRPSMGGRAGEQTDSIAVFASADERLRLEAVQMAVGMKEADGRMARVMPLAKRIVDFVKTGKLAKEDEDGANG